MGSTRNSIATLINENKHALNRLILLLLIFLASLILFSILKPKSADWHDYFVHVSRIPLKPYTIDYFLNLPWTALVLAPFSLISQDISWLINASLNAVVFSAIILKKDGKLLPLFLTLTSVPFVMLSGNGNIEWIPALGFLFPNAVGVIFLLTKPQSGIFAALDWFYRQKNKTLFLLVPSVWVLLSLLIWPGWPVDLVSNLSLVTKRFNTWNWSLFPWTIPVGIGLIYHIIRNKPDNGELLGVLATFCFSPYFAGYSVTILFTLTSIAHPRKSIVLWVLLWAYFFIVLV